MSTPDAFTPQPIRARSWAVLSLILLVGVVLYLWVVIVYNTEGGYTTSIDNTGLGSQVTQASVRVQPTAFDSQVNEGQLSMAFSITDYDSGLISAKGQLEQNVRFIIDGSSGTQEVRFPIGSRLGSKDVLLTTEGPSWAYPFDTHIGSLFVSAETYEKQPDGTVATVANLPLSVTVDEEAEAVDGVSGWDTAIGAYTYYDYSDFNITYTRGFSTKVFAMVLLLLAVVLAAATAVVAFLVAATRRRAEIGLMAWTASLLFALPALRSFMPNSPPIGAQIDMYVYLWVMVAAIIAAITVIVSWIRQSGWAILGRKTPLTHLPGDKSGDA